MHPTRRCSRRITLAFLPFEAKVSECAMCKYGQASAPAAKRYVMLKIKSRRAQKLAEVEVGGGASAECRPKNRSKRFGNYFAFGIIGSFCLIVAYVVIVVARKGNLGAVSLTILLNLGAVVFGIVAVELLSNCVRVARSSGFGSVRPPLIIAEATVLTILYLIQSNVPKLASMYFWLFAGFTAIAMIFIEIRHELFGKGNLN